MKTLTKVVTQQEFIAAYEAFLNSIIENAITLGQMLAGMMEQNPNTLDELAAKGFSRITLNRLYLIGIGLLDPRLLIDGSPAADYLRELPLPQQKKFLDEGLPVIVDVDARGQGVQKVKPVAMLTTKEIKKVFREDGSIRPATEQVQIVRAERNHAHVQPAERFKISEDGETIMVLEKTEFTLSRWIEISEQAQARQEKLLERNLKNRQIARK